MPIDCPSGRLALNNPMTNGLNAAIPRPVLLQHLSNPQWIDQNYRLGRQGY
jgi:hypothetical protein